MQLVRCMHGYMHKVSNVLSSLLLACSSELAGDNDATAYEEPMGQLSGCLVALLSCNCHHGLHAHQMHASFLP